MGRWSRHPMGSDGALDAKDCFMEKFDVHDDTNSNNDQYYFEREPEKIKEELEGLSLDDIKKMANNPCTKNNLFIIPYTFLEYKVNVKNPKIREYLKDCLNSHDDFDEYGNGEEEEHCNYFYNNFDDIIDGKLEYPNDEGLFAAIVEHINNDNPGLINLTSED